jgi:AAA domain/TrwC relaxase
VTRTGYHGTRVDGAEPGRFEPAGLVVTSWLQGTSRDGDPQDHVHNQIARVTRTFRDGKWRVLDTASLRQVIGALQAVAATAAECGLTREFGVRWVPRPDGRGNEVVGITHAQMDAYSTRTVAVHAKERELAAVWQRRHGRTPNARELFYMSKSATLLSRQGKQDGQIDWDALALRWDATLGGDLAGIAPAVSSARGPDEPAADGGGPEPSGADGAGQLLPETRLRVVHKALALVTEKHSTWTRHDLLKHLALIMPTETRRLAPGAAQALLAGLADQALSGQIGDVVCLEAPQWPPLPAALRRSLDGRSIYTRPGTARYATAGQPSAEERLIVQAQARGAPHLTAQQAAERLGADQALLDAQLRARVPEAQAQATRRGLRLDQAAAVYHVLTSDRVVEVIVGPAGTGKTRALAAARAWAQTFGPGRVVGTATSQNATNELRTAGVEVAANTTRLLADIDRGRIRPGSLIVVDEGSMVSMAHQAALVGHAARTGCKIVLAGDQEQLAAVEGGGAMMLLAGRLGYVQLAEPVRFTGGGVMVRRQLDPEPDTGQRRFTAQAFHYPGYATADLAYAVTGHAAQGGTVHTGIALVTGGEDRHWLYPAMTRGTHTNLVFVFTTPPTSADPQPRTRPAPELHRAQRTPLEREGHLPPPAPLPDGPHPGGRSPCSPTFSSGMELNYRQPRPGGATWLTPTTWPSWARSGPPRHATASASGTATYGSGPPRSPAAWPSPPTPNYAAATPASRSRP